MISRRGFFGQLLTGVVSLSGFGVLISAARGSKIRPLALRITPVPNGSHLGVWEGRPYVVFECPKCHRGLCVLTNTDKGLLRRMYACAPSASTAMIRSGIGQIAVTAVKETKGQLSRKTCLHCEKEYARLSQALKWKKEKNFLFRNSEDYEALLPFTIPQLLGEV